MASEEDGKATGWRAHYVDGKWVEQAAPPKKKKAAAKKKPAARKKAATKRRVVKSRLVTIRLRIPSRKAHNRGNGRIARRTWGDARESGSA